VDHWWQQSLKYLFTGPFGGTVCPPYGK
jgi:hypothetical protein